MTDMLDYISTWSVLKWVILVLIAGFIGQFGRMLAEFMIARVRRRRTGQQPLTDYAKPPEDRSVPPVDVPVELPPQPVALLEIPDKKMLKAMAKAGKKEAKKK